MTESSTVRAEPGTLVLTRSERLERRARRALTVNVTIQLLSTALLLGMSVGIGRWIGWATAIPFLALGLLECAYLGFTVWWWQTERRAGGFRLWLTADGLGYTCRAGTFPIGWDAVRSARIVPTRRSGRVRTLWLTADGWDGPARRPWNRRKAVVRVPLQDQDVAMADLAGAITRLSGGRVTPS